MTDYEKIESYVDDLLNLSGVVNGEGERSVWLLLHHLYCAVAMFSLMNDSERALIKGVQRRLKYFFSFNVSIKQRKRRTEKEILPPVPLSLEKENKEKEEKTTLSAGRTLSLPLSDLEKRQNAFKMEIWNHRGNIDMDMLNDFYYYWTDLNPKTQKMRFEEQERYFSVENRLKRWKKNEISNSIAASKIRLKRTKKRDEQEQTAAEKSQAAAAVREQENAEREARAEESRQTQMLTDEYVKAHPDSLMAKIYKKTKT